MADQNFGLGLASLAKVNVDVGVAIRAGFTSNPGRYLFFLIMFPFVSLSFVFSNCERLVEPLCLLRRKTTKSLQLAAVFNQAPDSGGKHWPETLLHSHCVRVEF